MKGENNTFLSAIFYLLFVICYLLFVICYLLFVICYFLFLIQFLSVSVTHVPREAVAPAAGDWEDTWPAPSIFTS